MWRTYFRYPFHRKTSINNYYFGLQYIASVSTERTHVLLDETDGPQPSTSTSTERSHGAVLPDETDEPRASSSTCTETSHALPDETDKPQPSTSTSDELAVSQPDTDVLVQSQEIEVKESVDFGCQVNTRGTQVMLKSFETQIDQVSTSEASTQFEEDDLQTTVPKVEDITEEDNAETVSPGVSPQKDPAYQPSSPTDKLSDDFNTSEDEEEENCKPLNPQDDTKFIVFKKELFELFKRCPECGAVVNKKHQSILNVPNVPKV